MKKLLLLAVLLFAATAAQAQTLPCPASSVCSGAVTFTVAFGAPGTPASISPTSAVAGSSAAVPVTLTPTSGSVFNAQMTVQACQATPTPCTTPVALVTTFNSTGTLTATLPAALLATSGTYSIYIAQPANAHASLLQWNGSTSVVAGYNVYRGSVSGGPTQSSIPHSSAA